jgi:hypothetical protein
MTIKNALLVSLFLLAAACGGGKPKTQPEPKPEPDPHGEIPCSAEIALACDTESADGCLDGRTLFHVCVPNGETAGPPCEQEIAKVCGEGQIDACLATPQYSTSHLCVHATAKAAPAAGTCPEGQAFYAPGCGSDTNPLTTEGCYAPCETASCGAGFTCKTATYNPCHNSMCDACGGEVKLCMPSS